MVTCARLILPGAADAPISGASWTCTFTLNGWLLSLPALVTLTATGLAASKLTRASSGLTVRAVSTDVLPVSSSATVVVTVYAPWACSTPPDTALVQVCILFPLVVQLWAPSASAEGKPGVLLPAPTRQAVE